MIAYRDENTEKDDNPKKYIGGVVEVKMIPIEDFEWSTAMNFAEQQINLPGEITEDIDYEIVEPKQLPDANNNK